MDISWSFYDSKRQIFFKNLMFFPPKTVGM